MFIYNVSYIAKLNQKS